MRTSFLDARVFFVAGLVMTGLMHRPALAGNVIVSVQNQELLIKGSQTTDLLTITNAPSGIQIKGLFGTKVNGAPSAIVSPVRTPFKSFKIALSDGSDRLFIDEVTLPVSGLDIDLGNGADRLEISNLQCAGTLLVSDGGTSDPSNDVIRIHNSTLNDAVLVNCGSGNDTIGIATSTAEAVQIKSGAGDDGIGLSLLEIAGSLEVDSGSGDDIVLAGDMEVGTAALDGGANSLFARGRLGGDVLIQLDLFFGSNFNFATDSVHFEHQYDTQFLFADATLEEDLISLAESRGLEI